MSEVFPHLRRAANHLLSFCTGCVQLRMCHESADLSPKGEGPGARSTGLLLRHRQDALSVPVSGGVTLNRAISKTAGLALF